MQEWLLKMLTKEQIKAVMPTLNALRLKTPVILNDATKTILWKIVREMERLKCPESMIVMVWCEQRLR